MSEEEFKNYDRDEYETEFHIKDNSDDESMEFTNYFDIILD